jgi:hypothetical protein
MSLDGYIAAPNGEADWIIMDPEIDFAEIFSRVDTWHSIPAIAGAAGLADADLSPPLQPIRQHVARVRHHSTVTGITSD